MLTPGAETDLLVARACGFDATTQHEFGDAVKPLECRVATSPVERIDGGLRVITKKFKPSTDLNDAFEAAEKVGLFVEWNGHLRLKGSLWSVIDPRFDREEDWLLGAGSSPALAICATILRLRENT